MGLKAYFCFQKTGIMRIDPIKNKYFEYLRDILKEKWNHNDYIGSNLTASGLKEILKKVLNNESDERKSVVIRFLGISNPLSVNELVLMNKSKCIENFYLGRSSCTNENTKQFIVDFFDVEIKSIDEYKAVFNSNSLLNSVSVINKHLSKWLKNKHYFVKPEVYNEVITNYNPRYNTSQENAYILACSLHYGNRIIKSISIENRNNDLAIETSLDMLVGYGIRVGWRAEYSLSFMNYENYLNIYLSKNPKKEAVINESLFRLKNGLTRQYVESIANTPNDHKLKDYAKQVLAIME